MAGNQVSVKFVVVILLGAFALNWFWFSGPITDRVYGLEPEGVEVSDYQADESIAQRSLFNGLAVEMIKANPLLGVGPKNFVVTMDDFGERLLPFQHQPAHNIYLLVAAESGVLALIAFLVLVYNIVRPTASRFRQAMAGKHSEGEIKKDPMLSGTLLILVFGILLLGLLDHYPWTIQQGSLLFWTMLGLAAASE